MAIFNDVLRQVGLGPVNPQIGYRRLPGGNFSGPMPGTPIVPIYSGPRLPGTPVRPVSGPAKPNPSSPILNRTGPAIRNRLAF